MSSQIRRAAVISYSAVAFNAVAGLLYTPWMVATIGNDHYGLYTLAMSVINFFVMDFGLGDAVARYLSKFYAENDGDRANAFILMILKLYLAIDLILISVLLIIYINIDVIYTNLSPEQLIIFKRLYLVVSIYTIASFPCASLNGMLTANELFVKLNACNLLQKVSTVALIIIALVAGAGVYALVLVNAVVGLTTYYIKYIIVKRDTAIRLSCKQHPDLMVSEVLGFSAWTMVAQIAQRFIFTLMPSVMAMVSNTWEIAVFGLASSLEGYVWTVANALNGMFMPKVTRVLYGENPDNGMQNLTIRVGRIQLAITGAIIIIFSAIGRDFIYCWVGPEYKSLYLCTLLLILPELVELPTMIQGTAIVAAGLVKEKGIVYSLMAISNLVLGFVLSSLFGAIGACAAICIAYFIRTTGMCVLYVKHLGFLIRDFAAKTYSRWIIPACVTLATGRIILLSHSQVTWPIFLLEGVIVFSIYLLLCWLFMLNSEEKEQISILLSKFSRIANL